MRWRELELGEGFFRAAAVRLCQELLRIITRMNEWTICGIPFASWLKGGTCEGQVGLMLAVRPMDPLVTV